MKKNKLPKQTATPADPISSIRAPHRKPRLQRRTWILGFEPERSQVLADALAKVGHECRLGEAASDVIPVLREYRPDIIVIDMQDQPDRGRHTCQQLRAERATRQVPLVLVGLSDAEEIEKTDNAVTGPTRRYALPVETPSVINAILVELH